MHSTCTEQQFEKAVFGKNVFFDRFRIAIENNDPSDEKILTGFSKLSSICRDEDFQGKKLQESQCIFPHFRSNVFEIVHVFFPILVDRRKSIRLLREFFLRFVKTEFYVSRRTFSGKNVFDLFVHLFGFRTQVFWLFGDKKLTRLS